MVICPWVSTSTRCSSVLTRWELNKQSSTAKPFQRFISTTLHSTPLSPKWSKKASTLFCCTTFNTIPATTSLIWLLPWKKTNSKMTRNQTPCWRKSLDLFGKTDASDHWFWASDWATFTQGLCTMGFLAWFAILSSTLRTNAFWCSATGLAVQRPCFR